MMLHERMQNWYQRTDNTEDCDLSAVEEPRLEDLSTERADDAIQSFHLNDNEREGNEPDADSDIDLPGLNSYREFIIGTTAYEWLIRAVRRELELVSSEPNSMESIASQIRQKVFSLPSFRNISRNASPQECKIMFTIPWDPRAFVKEQEYQEMAADAIARAITLTGAAGNTQALTCEQYLKQTWPLSGKHTIQLVQDVVRSDKDSQHTRKLIACPGLI
jgi:hypothetical protein